VFKELVRRGYVTAGHFGDEPKIGAFSMRLKGFKKDPVDHYMTPMFSYLTSEGAQYLSKATPDCFDGDNHGMLSVKYASDFMRAYKDIPAFFYGHLLRQHHRSRGAAQGSAGRGIKGVSDPLGLLARPP
jgi:hypothetical protein